jgi:hypothetical protein
MTDAPSHLSESPSPDPMIWLGGLLSIAAGVALFVAIQPGPSDEAPDDAAPTGPSMDEAPHPLAFPPLPANPQTLEGARADKYGEARQTLEQNAEAAEVQQKLIDLVREANRKQFSAGESGSDEERKRLSRRISVAANEVIRHLSYDTFPAAGRPVYTACRRGLAALLEAVRSGDIDFGAAETEAPASDFDTYRSNCGMLLPVLSNRGLVLENGEWAEPVEQSKTIFSVLQRVRWAHMTHDRRPFLLQLTPEERALYLRWRIESPRAFSMVDRQHFLSQLAADKGLLPDYDVQLAWARLEWAAGRADAAEKRLEDALDGATPEARERYRRALDWLSSHEAKPSNEDG